MKKTLLNLFVVALFISILVYFFGKEYWLNNVLVAYVTSSLVILGSMLSYKNMVDGRLNVGAIPDDERDTLDKLEDPYDLYDENRGVEEDEKTLVEVVKEERQNLKKSRRTVWQTTKDSKTALSVYRLFAYGILVLGFFYLNSNHILRLLPYLIALGIPSLVVTFSFMKNR
jgi:hypothetical protein